MEKGRTAPRRIVDLISWDFRSRCACLLGLDVDLLDALDLASVHIHFGIIFWFLAGQNKSPHNLHTHLCWYVFDLNVRRKNDSFSYFIGNRLRVPEKIGANEMICFEIGMWWSRLVRKFNYNKDQKMWAIHVRFFEHTRHINAIIIITKTSRHILEICK